MTDADRALEMLKSPDFHTRQKACEELGAATSLSKEAIDALTNATSDRFDPVANAAARALAAHQPSVARTPRVVIADFDMPFMSLVGFMIKVAIASIPAAIIVSIFYAAIVFIGGFFLTILGAPLGGLGS